MSWCGSSGSQNTAVPPQGEKLEEEKTSWRTGKAIHSKKLQTRESKLKEKSDSKKRRKKKKPKSQNKTSLSDKLKKAAKDAFRFVKKRI